jgi:hypothetical protein
MFRECLRLYYYHYYRSLDGSRPSADPFARELYLMRHLTTRPMWVGTVVHSQARKIVSGAKGQARVSPDEAVTQLRRRMGYDWQASRSGRYRENPSGMLGLVDDYYGPSPEPDAFAIHFHYAANCVRTVFDTDAYRLLAGDPAVRFLEAEERHKLEVCGHTVWVVLDLAIRLADGRIVIVDWKTGGDSPATRLQLAVYALYATQRWTVPPEQITTWEVRLGHGPQAIPHPIDADSLAWAEDTIRTSAEAMLSLLADRDRNLARESDFPMSENLDLCSGCRFRRACSRESTYAQTVPHSFNSADPAAVAASLSAPTASIATAPPAPTPPAPTTGLAAAPSSTDSPATSASTSSACPTATTASAARAAPSASAKASATSEP